MTSAATTPAGVASAGAMSADTATVSVGECPDNQRKLQAVVQEMQDRFIG